VRGLIRNLGTLPEYCVMKIVDVICPVCGSSYLMAESVSVIGGPGQQDCSVCGSTLATWTDRHRRAFRLVLSPQHKYPTVLRRRVSRARQKHARATA